MTAGSAEPPVIDLIPVHGALTTARRVACELAHGPLPHGQRVAGCPDDPRCLRLAT